MAASSHSEKFANVVRSEAKAPIEPIPFIDLAAQQRRIRPEIDAAIKRVLDHGQYIMGPEVFELERRLAAYTGAKHAITCSSGTDALLIAMMAKGIGPGDAVLCPDFTYTATPETIALLGASPVFVDVREDTFNIDPEGLAAGVEAARQAGLRPRAIIAVDLFGLPADYDSIHAFARAHDLFVMADAAQSFGATYKGHRTGSLAEITATSFFPAKPLGCYGDGGAIFTDDDDLAAVMKSIRLHGKGADKYDIVRIGVNGRLDTIQAAILLVKLGIFDEEVAARDLVAEQLSESLRACVNVATPTVPRNYTSVWAQYTLRIAGGQRNEVAKAFADSGIPTQVYYPRPLSAQLAYQVFPVAINSTPAAKRLAEEVLSLPLHPYCVSVVQNTFAEHAVFLKMD